MLSIEDLEAAARVLREMRPEFVYRGNNRKHAAYTAVMNDVHQVIRNARDIDDKAHVG
jgi:hypothetical protein